MTGPSRPSRASATFDDTLQWWFPSDEHTVERRATPAATSRRGTASTCPRPGSTIRVNGFGKKGNQINLSVN